MHQLSYALLATCLLPLLAPAPVTALSYVGNQLPRQIHEHQVQQAKRMVKKRAPANFLGVDNAANPGGGNQVVTTSSTPPAAVVTTSSTPVATSTTSVQGSINVQVDSSSTTSASSSSVSSVAPTTSIPVVVATTSTPSTTSSQSIFRPSTAIVASTIDALPTASAAAEETKSNSFGKNSIIAIAVIASCIGGAAAIWTLIRKWKLGPSAKFEDRVKPIEWSPEDDAGLPGAARGDKAGDLNEKHKRGGSAGSHGSFHSGDVDYNNNQNQGRNVTGNANAYDQNPASYALEAHDFTAGPAGTYNNPTTYNNYVDLQRSNSGGRDESSGLTRQPSYGNQRAYDQYAAYDDAYATDAYGGYDSYGQQPQHPQQYDTTAHQYGNNTTAAGGYTQNGRY